jgi:hypothetical protein
VTRKVPVHVVVRLDSFGPEVPAEHAVTVTAVLPTYDEAEAEAARLNELNADKGCRYFCQTTRYYPEGRKRRS